MHSVWQQSTFINAQPGKQEIELLIKMHKMKKPMTINPNSLGLIFLKLEH